MQQTSNQFSYTEDSMVGRAIDFIDAKIADTYLPLINKH